RHLSSIVFPYTTLFRSSCANSYVLTRTWTATDECGNSTSHTQTITVADTIAPDITLPASTTMTVECDGAGNTTEFDAWIANHGGDRKSTRLNSSHVKIS